MMINLYIAGSVFIGVLTYFMLRSAVAPRATREEKTEALVLAVLAAVVWPALVTLGLFALLIVIARELFRAFRV